MMISRRHHPSGLIAFLCLTLSAGADEGMWLLNEPPRAALEKQYGFVVTDAWLDHLMHGAVRFNRGGSGAFVSADGLVIANQHVVSSDLQNLGGTQHDYLRDGFLARIQADEKPCPGMELDVLQSIEDVTARVQAAVPASASDAATAAARRAVLAQIEAESLERTKLASEVVTLHQGGAYHLYRYKRYTDVRLVFAPEEGIANFGGDPDNFEYPRFAIDVAFFRIYENGRPVASPHFFPLTTSGVKEGELTFLAGHPGQTAREFGAAELVASRDRQFPYTLNRTRRIELLLRLWSERDAAQARLAHDELLNWQNGRKLIEGQQAGLYLPALLAGKAAAEQELVRHSTDRATTQELTDALARLAALADEQAVIFRDYQLLERADAFWSESFPYARDLLRAGDERPKPNGERLREYTDARRDSFEAALLAERTIAVDYEILKLGDALTFFAEQAGFADPLVQQVLAGQSPRERAATLIKGTKVRDAAFRRQLLEGGAAAVRTARDPLIELARLIDGPARELRRKWDQIAEAKRQSRAALSRARYRIEGAGRAPDATFTLRLSYGIVQGYEEAGATVPAFTTLAGLYGRAEQQEFKDPFALPTRWIERRSALEGATPLNFVTTTDAVGGSSGSPVLNRAGQLVGVFFDGNLGSLALSFAYDETRSRSLAVDARAIVTALREVYGADALLAELLPTTR
jgi:hypothetical protein